MEKIRFIITEESMKRLHDSLRFFENIFNQAVIIQKDKFSKKINELEAERGLNKIQKELDKFVEEMYLC
jgi:hypothetical protein